MPVVQGGGPQTLCVAAAAHSHIYAAADFEDIASVQSSRLTYAAWAERAFDSTSIKRAGRIMAKTCIP